MNAITLMPPYAQCVGRIKHYATRRTKILQSCVGKRIAIACGKDMRELMDIQQSLTFGGHADPSKRIMRSHLQHWDIDLFDLDDFTPYLGHILLTAHVTSCVLITDWFIAQQTALERACGYWYAGYYASKLDDIRILDKPVAARGYPGLWQVDDAAVS